MKPIYLLLFLLFSASVLPAGAAAPRWKINEKGGITWQVGENDSHADHIEMSGRYLSAVIRYGVNADGSFSLSRTLVWPMLRTIPNDTHASLIRTFDFNPLSSLTINKRLAAAEQVSSVELNGTLVVNSTLSGNFGLTRTLYPSTGLPVYFEKYELKNNSTKPAVVEVPEVSLVTRTHAADGVDGEYTLRVRSAQSGTTRLEPGGSLTFYLAFSGEKSHQPLESFDGGQELAKRLAFLGEVEQKLVLDTPDKVLNRAFAFAKIRASESIYQTKGGPMHGPGGLSFYAAIWANDQAEYINPFFPYLGYDYGIESALNAYRHFARFMNPQYRPIPSSVIAEGTDIWDGAGDRGDAAMIAYGAARFALTLGNRKVADELWPLVEWCLEYNQRNLNAQGVVSSDSDELEGRFPAGSANLCTSSLYYDALVSAQYLGKSLGKSAELLSAYNKQANTLKKNIESYFGAHVMGFDTYRYYDGNDKLRAWICIPLTAGIFDRKAGTIEALFSPELWTPDGVATESGDKTFWDRATLYALRGVFAAGERERALKYLTYYSGRRLLGEHVPYPVEAYPERNQAHLSAESGLYCRIYTEGLFGIRPAGFTSFVATPQLPDEWDHMALRRVHGYGRVFDLEITRSGSKLNLLVRVGGKVVQQKTVRNGESVLIQL